MISPAEASTTDPIRSLHLHVTEAVIPTEHARKYLGQLCRHASKMAGHSNTPPASHVPPASDSASAALHVACADASGTIRLGDGLCILRASDSVLLLRIEAPTADGLRRLQKGISHRLQIFGHRERLMIPWETATAASTGLPEVSPSSIASPAQVIVWWRSRLVRRIALVGVVALAVAVHLGLLGLTFGTVRWAEWGAGAIFAMVVLKVIITGAVHFGGGSYALRHARAFIDHHKEPRTPV